MSNGRLLWGNRFWLCRATVRSIRRELPALYPPTASKSSFSKALQVIHPPARIGTSWLKHAESSISNNWKRTAKNLLPAGKRSMYVCTWSVWSTRCERHVSSPLAGGKTNRRARVLLPVRYPGPAAGLPPETSAYSCLRLARTDASIA